MIRYRKYINDNDADASLINLMSEFKNESSVFLLDKLNNQHKKLSPSVYNNIRNFLENVDEIIDDNLGINEKFDLIKDLIKENKTYIYKNYNDEELYISKSFYSIYLHSLEFWSPIKYGGLGMYDSYFIEFDDIVKPIDDNINTIASKDAVAGLFAGIGSLGNPFIAICAAAGASAIAAM